MQHLRVCLCLAVFVVCCAKKQCQIVSISGSVVCDGEEVAYRITLLHREGLYDFADVEKLNLTKGEAFSMSFSKKPSAYDDDNYSVRIQMLSPNPLPKIPHTYQQYCLEDATRVLRISPGQTTVELGEIDLLLRQ